MTRSVFIVATLMAELLSPPAFSQQKDEESAVTVQVGYWSRYVRRGFDLNRGLPVLEPSVTLALPLSLSAEATGFMGVSEKNLGEVDLSLSSTQSLWSDWLEWSVAFCSYQYLGSPEIDYVADGSSYANSQELILGVWTQNTPVDLSLEVGRGLGGEHGDDIKGNYASAALEKEVDLGLLSWEPGVSATYLDEYGIPNRITELAVRNDFVLDLDAITVTPNVSYLYLPIPRLLNNDDNHDIWVFGVKVSTGW